MKGRILQTKIIQTFALSMDLANRLRILTARTQVDSAVDTWLRRFTVSSDDPPPLLVPAATALPPLPAPLSLDEYGFTPADYDELRKLTYVPDFLKGQAFFDHAVQSLAMRAQVLQFIRTTQTHNRKAVHQYEAKAAKAAKAAEKAAVRTRKAELVKCRRFNVSTVVEALLIYALESLETDVTTEIVNIRSHKNRDAGKAAKQFAYVGSRQEIALSTDN
jgi:hypothetical protein